MQVILFKDEKESIPFVENKKHPSRSMSPKKRGTLRRDDSFYPNDDITAQLEQKEEGKSPSKKRGKSKKKKKEKQVKHEDTGLQKLQVNKMIPSGALLTPGMYFFYPSQEETQKLIQKVCLTKKFKLIMKIANGEDILDTKT